MRKIPTLFKRDPENMRRVLPEVHPDCQWVLDGEGVALRKYDGTCLLFDGMVWWARRDVKPGKQEPPRFVAVEHDENTGKTVGWEPAEQSSFWRILDAVLEEHDNPAFPPPSGTYELIGPKINGNPESKPEHALIYHANADPLPSAPRTYERLRDWLLAHEYEGLVWHHPDGRLAKLKRRDFQ